MASSVSALISLCSVFNRALVSVCPPASGPVPNIRLTVAYDQSGSMDDKAAPGDSKLTKHDLGAHAVNIMAKALGPNDTLEVLGYEDTVRTVYKTASMTEANQNAVVNAIKAVSPGGGTALWSGLQGSLQSAQIQSRENANSVCILVTDGQPSSSPAAGEVVALTKFRKDTNNQSRLHTMGVGYNVNSRLLMDLVRVGGGGQYFFVPDGTLLITNVVALLALERATMGKELKVKIAGPDLSRMTVFGNYPIKYDDGFLLVDMGTLRYGQTRDLAVEFPQGKTYLDYTITTSWTPVSSTAPATLPATVVQNSAAVQNEVLRSNAVSALFTAQATVNLADASKLIGNTVDTLKASGFTHPILVDLEGEAKKAVENLDAWNRWGQHHLRYNAMAHLGQVCPNFKDPGVQKYGGVHHQTLRDALNDISDSLPPPVHLGYSGYADYGYGSGQPSVAAPVSRAAFASEFNNADGGCFAGHVLVRMDDDQWTQFSDLTAGQVVKGGAKILCVTHHTNVTTVTTQEDIESTAWHPYIKPGTGLWVFPADNVAHTRTQKHAIVYNLVLDKGHLIQIKSAWSEDQEGQAAAQVVTTCTLGHGLEGPVIGHAFFGSHKVIDNLSSFPGWSKGLVVLNANNQVRDPITGKVTGYKV